ncbi:hypothetical protein Tco_0622383 [Tanacetum coccineum]
MVNVLQQHLEIDRRTISSQRGAGRVNTCDKTQNLSLKDIVEAKGPVSIHFDVGDKQTLNPLGPHAAHWSNYIGEVVRSVPLYYPSWEKVPKEQKAAIISNIKAAHGSSRSIEIYETSTSICKKPTIPYKASSNSQHWKVGPPDQASDTQEYPSLIDTFWRTHTVDGVFPKDEDRHIYEEMKRPKSMGEYTEDDINRLEKARGSNMKKRELAGVVKTRRVAMIDDGDDEIMGPTSSLGIIAGERIPYEASPASIPQRQVAGDTFPQRHVAGERPDNSPGKGAIVVVSNYHQSGASISLGDLELALKYFHDKPIKINESYMIWLHYTSDIWEEWKEAKNFVTFCFLENENIEVKECGARVVSDEDLEQDIINVFDRLSQRGGVMYLSGLRGYMKWSW